MDPVGKDAGGGEPAEADDVHLPPTRVRSCRDELVDAGQLSQSLGTDDGPQERGEAVTPDGGVLEPLGAGQLEHVLPHRGDERGRIARHGLPDAIDLGGVLVGIGRSVARRQAVTHLGQGTRRRP